MFGDEEDFYSRAFVRLCAPCGDSARGVFVCDRRGDRASRKAATRARHDEQQHDGHAARIRILIFRDFFLDGAKGSCV
jgi:hypothetical protein